jgi:hypothetical protein
MHALLMQQEPPPSQHESGSRTMSWELGAHQWKRSSPAGPAEQEVGGSLCGSTGTRSGQHV